MLGSKGFGIIELVVLILGAMILTLMLPLLEPFLAGGIAATGGTTGIIIAMIPLFLVAGFVIKTITNKPRPYAESW